MFSHFPSGGSRPFFGRRTPRSWWLRWLCRTAWAQRRRWLSRVETVAFIVSGVDPSGLDPIPFKSQKNPKTLRSSCLIVSIVHSLRLVEILSCHSSWQSTKPWFSVLNGIYCVVKPWLAHVWTIQACWRKRWPSSRLSFKAVSDATGWIIASPVAKNWNDGH